MVCPERSRASESESERELMEVGLERSKRLHNFELPCLWGRQRFLRCMKLDSSDSGGEDRRSRFAGGDSSSSGSRRREEEDPGFPRKPNRVSAARDSNPIRAGAAAAAAMRSRIDEEGIEAVREKLTLDLKTAASKMKDAILGKTAAAEEHVAPPPPWNLRTRRAACKEPPEERRSASYSPPRVDGGGGAKPEKERPKFVVGLSRKEIEDDFAAILGQRPPRRPKKRAKIVQKQLDSLFPGLWLTEVSEDMYKVAENPDNGKRQ